MHWVQQDAKEFRLDFGVFCIVRELGFVAKQQLFDWRLDRLGADGRHKALPFFFWALRMFVQI